VKAGIFVSRTAATRKLFFGPLAEGGGHFVLLYPRRLCSSRISSAMGSDKIYVNARLDVV
jgi:hypothetical protein